MSKISWKYICLLLLWTSNCIIVAQWEQVGNTIDGDNQGDQFGCSVAISSDGTKFASGALFNDGNGQSSGQVKIFNNIDGSWQQVGNSIFGQAGDQSGSKICLNDQGTIVAISSKYNDNKGENSGCVRVYKEIDGNWVQLGEDIKGVSAHDRLGNGLDLNSDGTILAVGAHLNDDNGDDTGHVRVYMYSMSSWVQLGNTIKGESTGDQAGFSLSLNQDGNIVAIGARGSSENGEYTGSIRVYELNGNSWTQKGNTIVGSGKNNSFGSSVCINADGNILIGGSPGYHGDGAYRGQARVFENNMGVWNQIGDDLNGEEDGDSYGFYVRINSDGSRIGVSSAYSNNYAGHVDFYQRNGNSWVNLKQRIYGAQSSAQSGWSLDMSDEGFTAVIGSIYASLNGFVKLYEVNSTNPIVSRNNYLSLVSGSTMIISSNYLSIKDDDTTTDDIEYRIIQDPINGYLCFIHDQESSISTFSQYDIDNNQIAYVHDGLNVENDNFYFTVSDGTSLLENQHFRIYVDFATKIETDKNQEDIQVFLSPSNSIMNVKSMNIINVISLIDLGGNFVYRKEIKQPINNLQLDTSSFKKGLYILRVNSGGNVYSEKIYIKGIE